MEFTELFGDLNWIHVLLISVACIFAVVIRLPFVLWGGGLGGDSLGVYSYIYRLSKSTKINYYLEDAVNFEGYFPRPALIHYIISRFPRKVWRPVGVFINFLFDVITGLVVLVLTLFMLNESPLVEDPWSFAILGLFIFFSSPLLLPVTARLRATNSRSLGLFLGTCYFTSVYFTQFGGIWPIMGVVLFAYLTILSSTFAMQAIFFMTPILCIVIGNYIPIIALLSMIILFWFLPFTGLKEILFFKWAHIKFYLKNIQTSVSTRNRKFIINTISFFFAPKSLAHKQQLFLYDAPLLILLYSIPFLFIFMRWFFNDVSWALSKFEYIQDGSLENFCIAMGISSFVVFVITSIGKGKIFGESERYFEFSLPFLTALLIVFLEFNTPLDFILVSSIIVIQIGTATLINFLSVKSAVPSLLYFEFDESSKLLIDWFGTHDKNAKVAVIPVRYGPSLASAQLKTKDVRCRFYHHFIMPRNQLKRGFVDYLSEVHNKNTFKVTPEVLKEKYGIEYMVVNKPFLEKRVPQYFHHLSKYEEIKIDEEFYVYPLKQ